MSVASIKKIPDEHRQKIRRAGGDPEHPEVIKSYCYWANMAVRMSGHGTLSDDRLMTIAAVKLRDDYDKPKFLPNGGAGLSPAQQAKADAEKATVQSGAL